MKKNKALSIVVVTLFALSLVLTGCGQKAGPSQASEENKPVKLTFASYLPSGNVFEEFVLNPMIEKLKAENVNIEIQYYPGSTLLAAKDLLDGVEDGTADIGLIIPPYNAGRFPITSIVEYPIEFTSAKAASYTLLEALETLKPAEIESFKLLFSYCSGPGIIVSNKEIRKIDDFKGLQVSANAIQANVMTILGAVPSSLASSERYDALRTGIIDAFLGTRESPSSVKLEEVTKYGIYWPYANAAFYVAMNKDKYNSLSPAQQAALDKVSKEIFESTASDFSDKTGENTAIAMQKLNKEVINLSDPELQKLHDCVSGMLADYAKSLDEEGLKGTEALNTILELAEKNNAQYPLTTK